MMKKTIIELLKQTAQQYPNENYLYEKTDSGWKGTNFAQTDLSSDFFAVSLLKNGFLQNDKIGILSEGRTKWVISELGILKSRCISVPLSVKLTEEELSFRLVHSETKAIITSHNNIEKIIHILKKTELKNLKIIYLDNDTGFVETFEDKYNYFSVEDNVIFFDNMIKLAERTYDFDKEKIDEIINQIQEDDIVNISYTSGTTGNPKGIMLSHLNYFSNSLASASMFDVPKFSKLFIILPLDHSFAHTAGTFVGLQKPLALYFLDTRGGAMAALKNIPLNIKEVKPNLMITVPALSGNFMKNIIQNINKKGGFAKWLFNRGLEAGIAIYKDGFTEANKTTKAIKEPIYKLADKLVFSKIRENFGGELAFCVGGGALLDIKQQEFFNAIGMPVYQGYGLSEATPVISANTSNMHKFGTSGRVLENIECKIIDDGKELAQGKKGEIFIKAHSVMKGYFKNPEASAKVLRDQGLYTGDLGYFDEDGFLVVTGREKALLISVDGEKYSPEEIEELLANSEFINHVMLYNDHSKYTTALFTLDEIYIKSFIKEKKIKTTKKLLEHIEKSVSHILKEGEKKGYFPKKWLPVTFRIVPEQFTEQNKLVNSTMKMVRYKITERYKNLIDEMYLPEAKEDKEHNLKVLQKLF